MSKKKQSVYETLSGIYGWDPEILKKRTEELQDPLKQVERNSLRDALVKDVLKKDEVRLTIFLRLADQAFSLRDEYGDEESRQYKKELQRYIGKLWKTYPELKEAPMEQKLPGFPPVSVVTENLKNKLWTLVQAYRATRQSHTEPEIDFNALSGIEFENYVIELIRTLGAVSVLGTKQTGDQGADILFEASGESWVAQLKRHNSSIGNKAVQEVIAARAFYSARKACVITNSKFTDAARALATKAGIKLISGSSRSTLSEAISEGLGLNKSKMEAA